MTMHAMAITIYTTQLIKVRFSGTIKLKYNNYWRHGVGLLTVAMQLYIAALSCCS